MLSPNNDSNKKNYQTKPYSDIKRLDLLSNSMSEPKNLKNNQNELRPSFRCMNVSSTGRNRDENPYIHDEVYKKSLCVTERKKEEQRKQLITHEIKHKNLEQTVKKIQAKLKKNNHELLSYDSIGFRQNMRKFKENLNESYNQICDHKQNFTERKFLMHKKLKKITKDSFKLENLGNNYNELILKKDQIRLEKYFGIPSEDCKALETKLKKTISNNQSSIEDSPTQDFNSKIEQKYQLDKSNTYNYQENNQNTVKPKEFSYSQIKPETIIQEEYHYNNPEYQQSTLNLENQKKEIDQLSLDDSERISENKLYCEKSECDKKILNRTILNLSIFSSILHKSYVREKSGVGSNRKVMERGESIRLFKQTNAVQKPCVRFVNKSFQKPCFVVHKESKCLKSCDPNNLQDKSRELEVNLNISKKNHT